MNHEQPQETRQVSLFDIIVDEAEASKRNVYETKYEIQNKRLRPSETLTYPNENDSNLFIHTEKSASCSKASPETDDLLLNLDVNYDINSYYFPYTSELEGIEIQNHQSIEDSNLGSLFESNASTTSTKKYRTFDRSISESPALSCVDYDEVLSLTSVKDQTLMNLSPTTSQMSSNLSFPNIFRNESNQAIAFKAELNEVNSAATTNPNDKDHAEIFSANCIARGNKQSQYVPTIVNVWNPVTIIDPCEMRPTLLTHQISTDCISYRGPLLHFPTDNRYLTEQQIFIRKQIEFFEVALIDVGKVTSGRRIPIKKNQVGIQCRHCAVIPGCNRERGAVHFPTKLMGIYQSGQDIANTHMIQRCKHVDPHTKKILLAYKQSRCLGHGGKKYWAETAKAQGVVDNLLEGGLCFEIRRNSKSI